MKRVFCWILTLVLVLGLSIPAFAENDWPKIMDEAGLLTEEERAELEERAQSIANAYGMDVVIVTNDSLDGKTATEYADDYFDYNGYGLGEEESGTLLLVSMGERDWAISTKGTAIRAVTDWGNEQLQDAMLPDLSSGDYADAFNSYLDQLDSLYDSYVSRGSESGGDGSGDSSGGSVLLVLRQGEAHLWPGPALHCDCGGGFRHFRCGNGQEHELRPGQTPGQGVSCKGQLPPEPVPGPVPVLHRDQNPAGSRGGSRRRQLHPCEQQRQHPWRLKR